MRYISKIKKRRLCVLNAELLIKDITDIRQMNNAQLKRIIQKIEVDKDGNVDIYLRLLGDLGLDETVPIHHDKTQGRVHPAQISAVKSRPIPSGQGGFFTSPGGTGAAHLFPAG